MNKVTKIYVKPGEFVQITARDCGITREAGIAGKKVTVCICGYRVTMGVYEHSYSGVIASLTTKTSKVTLPLGSLGFYIDEKGVYYTVPRQVKL